MDDIHQHELEEEGEDEDYHGQMMEVQPDIVTHDEHEHEDEDHHRRDDHGHSEEHDHHDQDDQDARLMPNIPEPQHHPGIKEEGVDPIATN